MQSFDPQHIKGYHAHVYYNSPAEREIAARIRDAVEDQFDVEMGRWRDEPVGPHPAPMYQIAFAPELLPQLLPWLMSVSASLSILVHARTGQSDLLDHTAGAVWLGPQLELNTAFFGDEIGRTA